MCMLTLSLEVWLCGYALKFSCPCGVHDCFWRPPQSPKCQACHLENLLCHKPCLAHDL